MRKFYEYINTCREAGKALQRRFVISPSLLSRILYREKELSYANEDEFRNAINDAISRGSKVIRDRLLMLVHRREVVITPVSFRGASLVDIKITNKPYRNKN